MSPDPNRAPKRRLPLLIKALIAIVAIGVLGVLFIRTANDARSEPYAMSAGHTKGWTLAADVAADADGAVVSLRPPAELAMNLFRQLFSRQMESMSTPSEPGIALVLRREIPAGTAAGELIALARAAGLEQATLIPKCVGYRRISDPGITRQLYFLWFDVPGFDRFRQAAAARVGSGFDSKALSPALLMAAQPTFAGWQPIVVDEQRDCVAAVAVSP